MTRTDVKNSKLGDLVEFPDGTRATIRGIDTQDESVTLEIPQTQTTGTDSAIPVPLARPHDPPVEVMPSSVFVPEGPQKTTVIFSWRELAAAARSA